MNELEGHVTMLIDDECWTFPLSPFTNTFIAWWAPGREGVFHQELLPMEVAHQYYLKAARWGRRYRRWGWVNHVSWKLADRLVGAAPRPPGSHQIEHNVASQYVLMDFANVLMRHNVTEGLSTAVAVRDGVSMIRPALLIVALLLTSCGQHIDIVPVQLSPADVRFDNAIRANTRTLWAMDDTDMALAGRDVCTVLARGGTVEAAARLLVPATSVRGQEDAAYFAGLARNDFCPQYPATKPAPKG